MDKQNNGKLKKLTKELVSEVYEVAKPKVKELADEITDNAKNYIIGMAIPKAKDIAKEVVPVAKNVATAAKDKTMELASGISEKAKAYLTEEEMLLILASLYDQTISGIPKISKPVDDICNEYLKRYKEPKLATKKLCASDIAKCTTSGFLTGFGGFITLPITIPANITSVLYVQIRMISSVANLAGFELQSDATRTFVYACLAGVSVAEVVKKTGIKVGEKMATSAISKIPGKALTAINQKVGFRLITKFGEKGVVNLGKMVPVVGAIVGGSFDLVETKMIANRAIKEFFDGEFDEDDNLDNSIIDADFEVIVNEELENIKQSI